MDIRVKENYQELENSLTEIVRDSKDSYWIIWLNIAEIVHQSNMESSADCLGTLMYQITGNNKWVMDIELACRDKTDCFQRVIQRYRFGKSLNEWGGFLEKTGL